MLTAFTLDFLRLDYRRKTGKKLIERWKNDPEWKHRRERIALWIFSENKVIQIFSENEVIDMAEDMGYTLDGYLDLRGFPFNIFIDI